MLTLPYQLTFQDHSFATHDLPRETPMASTAAPEPGLMNQADYPVPPGHTQEPGPVEQPPSVGWMAKGPRSEGGHFARRRPTGTRREGHQLGPLTPLAGCPVRIRVQRLNSGLRETTEDN